MTKIQKQRWVQRGTDSSLEIPTIAEAIVTPNCDKFDVTIFDLKKQEQAWPGCMERRAYPTRAGAKLAASAALKHLGFSAVSADQDNECKPASIWTMMAQEATLRGNGIEVPCVVTSRGGIWEATVTLAPYAFCAEFDDELSAKHAVLRFANMLIDWHP